MKIAKSRPSHRHLFDRLAAERQSTSMIERDLLAATAPFKRTTVDWVGLWYDPGDMRQCDRGAAQACRAVTDGGRLAWLVFDRHTARGYLALSDCHLTALDEAQRAWHRQRQVRARWSEVQALGRAVRRGQVRLEVRLEDVQAAPLCMAGIEGFLAKTGLARVTRIDGRFAAWLMAIEPQVGFVLFEAWLRQSQAAPLPQGAPAPQG